jgi:hypothetical protein
MKVPLLQCMSQLVAQSGGGQGVELGQLLGEQRKCMDGWSRLPSTRMTISDIGCALRQWF